MHQQYTVCSHHFGKISDSTSWQLALSGHLNSCSALKYLFCSTLEMMSCYSDG